MAETRLFCGTSGCAYPSGKPEFYPQDLPTTKFLAYYATRLNAVEVNYTYRRLASAATFEKWMRETQSGFLFLPKAHMKITHSLKLEDAEDFTRVFLESLDPLRLAGRLGPILFQLPPSLKADTHRLQHFLRLIPKGLRVAFEFRNKTWFEESVYETLREQNAALCLAEDENLEAPHVITADFIYLRLRKPDYSESQLASIAYRVEQYRANEYPTFAVFKHEESPGGALNAERLLVSQSAKKAAADG